MAFITQLTLIAECEDCGKREKQVHTGDEFGIREEEHELIRDFLMDLHFNQNWFADKVSYEETKILCPACKKKQDAA